MGKTETFLESTFLSENSLHSNFKQCIRSKSVSLGNFLINNDSYQILNEVLLHIGSPTVSKLWINILIIYFTFENRIKIEKLKKLVPKV